MFTDHKAPGPTTPLHNAFARPKILIMTSAEMEALQERGWSIECRQVVHRSYKELAASSVAARQIYLGDETDKKPTHRLILSHPKLFPNLSIESTRHVYEDSVPAPEEGPTCYSLCTQLLADIANVREELPKLQKAKDLQAQTGRPHLDSHQSSLSGDPAEHNFSALYG